MRFQNTTKQGPFFLSSPAPAPQIQHQQSIRPSVMGRLEKCLDECCYKWDECKYCLVCIVFLLISVGLVVLIVAFGFVRHIDVSVDEALLYQFDLVTSPATSLAYNFSLIMAIRNPNWAMSLLYTKPLEAVYKFEDQMFDRIRLADEGDNHPAGKTHLYHILSSSTSRGVLLENAGEAEYLKEKDTGVFQVEMEVIGRARYTLRRTKCDIEASCPLKLQLVPPGTNTVMFQKVKCNLSKTQKKSC